MFDVVFISYDEPNAEENWKLLVQQHPSAIRVHGVKGIPEAHREAARQVTTSHFFTVDGDNVIDEKFSWTGRIVDLQKNDPRVHVWRSLNPVNGLIYGYGGVKLWPTNHMDNYVEGVVDFTTTVATGGFKIQSGLASTTKFNTTPYTAWKGAYRECTKLSSNIIKNADEKSFNRLLVWCTVGLDADNGDYAILGARMGALNGLLKSNNASELTNINDFDFLSTNFDQLIDSAEFNIQDQIRDYGETLCTKWKVDLPLYTPQQSLLIKKILYDV